jgi:hypothetical protein
MPVPNCEAPETVLHRVCLRPVRTLAGFVANFVQEVMKGSCPGLGEDYAAKE